MFRRDMTYDGSLDLDLSLYLLNLQRDLNMKNIISFQPCLPLSYPSFDGSSSVEMFPSAAEYILTRSRLLACSQLDKYIDN